MIVATAGHIDHGKTALVRALTGVETDTLREERERGISIDLGFAHWSRPPAPPIGFVDVPGHERFVRNMVAGVSGIDCALLVVALDDGPMPQTLEHLQILELLGVSRGVVALAKCDRVDAARTQAVRAQVGALLASTGLRSAPTFAVSSITGEGVSAIGDALAALASEPPDERPADHAFRLAVDRVFSLPGRGTITAGCVHDGAVAVGDRVRVMPAGLEARVRSIQSAGRDVQRARAGERCALALTGVEARDPGRGDWVVGHDAPPPIEEFDARLVLLPAEARALPDLARLHLHHGTGATMARIRTPDHRPLEPGQPAICRVRLDRATCAFNGDRFILRDPSATRTIGGGRVLGPVFRSRDRAWAARVLPVLAACDLDATVDALLAAPPGEIDVERIRRVHGVPAVAVLRRAALRDGVACGADSRTVVARGVLDSIRAQILASLERAHRAQPEVTGVSQLRLKDEVAPDASGDVFGHALRSLADDGMVRWRGPFVALRGHVPQIPRRDAELWERVLPRLAESTVSPPSVRRLADDLRLDAQELRALLVRRSRDGEVWMITESRFFPRASVSALAATAAEVGASMPPDGWFKAAQYRDRIGAGRGLAIEILEFFDRVGVTLRRGEQRRMRAGWEQVVGPGRAIPATAGRGLSHA
jgi:selenocysteine-specific elongation factor